jgi:hypothetical protein
LDLLTTYTTRLGTTSNNSVTANLHTLQITVANTKSSAACSCSLATVSNSVDSSASHAQVLLSQPLVQKSCQFRQLPTANLTIAPSLLSLPSRAQLSSTNPQLCLNYLTAITRDSLNYSQLAWDPCCIALGRTQEKTPFPNIHSIVVGVFTDPCLETTDDDAPSFP